MTRIVAYTPRHNHPIVNDFTSMMVDMTRFEFMEGLAEAMAQPDRYGPSTCVWIVPGTYHGE
jgi:hypothetical protein